MIDTDTSIQHTVMVRFYGPILFIYLVNRTHDYLFGLADCCDDLVRNTKVSTDDFWRRKGEPLNPRLR
jgi:hypothetical protein